MSEILQDKAQKIQALGRLASARRESLTALDFDVYVSGLDTETADIVTAACAQLAGEQKGEYEPNFPTLGKVIAQCLRVRYQRAEASRLALESKVPTYLPARVSDEKFTEIREQFQAVIDRHKVR